MGKAQRGRVSIRALMITQNGRRFYFASIPVDDLFPYCYVAKRDEDPVHGFQRSLNEARADDIAKYLAEGTGSIPSNIVLSAQPGADLKYKAKAGSVSFVRAASQFLVLDGQHRLWGYNKCSKRHRVPVAIYSGLSRAEEAKLFIDINTTQRGVPAALLLDIKQTAEMETQQEQLLRELFDKLNADAKSPLAGKLSASRSLANRISRVTFNKALSTALSGVLGESSRAIRYGLIVNYISAFEAELNDKKMLVKAAFFEAIFEVLDEVVRNCVALYRELRKESLQKVVRPLARLNFSGVGGRSLQSKKSIVSAMQLALRKNVAVSEDML
jgi:DNA sulfur modification protein DndB